MSAATVRPERTVAGLPHRTAFVCLALVLLAFLGYPLLWPQAPVLEGDSAQYLEVARDLSDYSLDALHDRTLGYPLLLVLTGSSHAPTRALFFTSLLLHFASIWLLAVLLRSSGMYHRWLAYFAGALLLPPYVEPAAHVMTESFAEFTLIAGLVPLVLWFFRGGPWLLAVSAASFGFAALTRPVYQALVPALLMVILAVVRSRSELTYRDVATAGAALVFGGALFIGGAAYQNSVKFGFFGLTPTLGFHLSTKTMPFVERLPDEYATVRDILVRARDTELTASGGTHTGTQAVWRARPELEAATGLTTAELSSLLLRLNLWLIARAPVEYLQEVARSMSVYWFPPAGPLAAMGSSLLRWVWALTHLAVLLTFWLEIVVLTGVTVFEASRRWRGAGAEAPSLIRATAVQALSYVLAGTIVFYTMALSCFLDIGEMRQRRSTDALIVFMTFLGARIWCHSVRGGAEPDSPEAISARAV